jgi:peroxiredoxin Q/BCP
MSKQAQTPSRSKGGGGQRSSAARQRRQRRLVTQIAIVVVIAGVALFFLTRSGGGSGGGSHPTFAAGQPGPGAAAPEIKLPSTAGGTFDLADQRGKTVLLYFQEGVGCQPCWDQIRDIEKDMAPFRALGIDELVSIAGNPLNQLRQKVTDESLSTPLLADPELSLGQSYRANDYGMMGKSAYGHTFIVVGPDGRIRWRADYGGSPDYTMYVRPQALLTDLRAGLAKG